MSKRRTTKEFIEICEKVHHQKYDYYLVDYKSKEGKVDIICPIHGVFSQTAKLHINGSGCPKCSYIYRSNLYRKSKEEFVIEANKIHNSFFSYDNFEYVNALTKGIITCPIHGDFEQKPNDHLMGKGCPKCKMSYLEKEIFSSLKRCGVEFISQKKFEWLGGQSLDFYLVDYNVAIECQGKQHFISGCWGDESFYETQIERDIRKKRLCEENGVRLIYFTHENIQFDDFYNELNTYFDIDELIKKELNLKTTVWVDELNKFHETFLKKYGKSENIKVLGVDLSSNSEKHVENSFLLKQMNVYRKNGGKSIHIFEDEWLYKEDIVKSRLKILFGINENKIYARNCEIRVVCNDESKSFLEENHIQGNVNGLYKLGLYYNDELISYMSFGNLRKNLGNKNVNGTYELLRFCNKKNITVVGGASKLFKYFIKTYNPQKVISYCDLRWSDGDLYEILGFKLSHISRPNYFYVNEQCRKRENRFKYRKDVLINDGYDSSKTEHEIMLERGIYRIYDCGCKVFVYEN